MLILTRRITETLKIRTWIILIGSVTIFGGMTQAAVSSPPVPDVYSLPHGRPDRRGTEEQPIVITKPPDELRREMTADLQHAENELRTTIATIVLAAFTVALTVANIWLVRDARRVSDRQAADTLRSIAVAQKSADAMRDVAEATKNNAVLMSGMLSKQMRAYLTVEPGTAVYQDQHLRFEVKPVLVNNGLTPARKVCFRVMADIRDGLNGPPSPTIEELIVNDMGLAPRQQVTISRAVENRIPDSEVADVMAGKTRRLHGWGRVTYDDVYGGSWETKFYFSYQFPKLEKGYGINSYLSTTHNDAT